MPAPTRKLTAVPDVPAAPAAPTTRQQKALTKIERHKKKNKLGTYAHPEVRKPVLQTKDITRRATKQIEVQVRPSLWSRIKRVFEK